MRKIAAAIFVSALALSSSACSSDINVKESGNGECIQERSQKFLGITFSKNQNFINCK